MTGGDATAAERFEGSLPALHETLKQRSDRDERARRSRPATPVSRPVLTDEEALNIRI